MSPLRSSSRTMALLSRWGATTWIANPMSHGRAQINADIAEIRLARGRLDDMNGWTDDEMLVSAIVVRALIMRSERMADA